MERHDLLLLTAEEQEKIFHVCGLTAGQLFPEKKRQMEEKGYTFRIPAIIRRQETRAPDMWDIGFSFPWFEEGLRARISASVEEEKIQGLITPYELFRQPMPDSRSGPDSRWVRFLEKIKELGEEYEIIPGLYGSAGLWLATGLPYLHEYSDLDLTIRAAPFERMEAFYHRLLKVSLNCGIRVDMEIRVPEIGDVKAQELFSGQLKVVVRGLKNTGLYRRKNLVDRVNYLTGGQARP